MANIQQLKGNKVAGLRKLQTNIKKIAELYPQKANEQVYKTLLTIIAESKKIVNVDQGHLRDSSYVTPLSEIQRTGIGRGGYSADYALDLHEGNTNPKVKFQDIYEWVIRKGIATEQDGAYPIARAITEKIKTEGTHAYKFLEKAILKVMPEIEGNIATELKRLEKEVKE